MFPPVEPSVLENNPDFASLHRALTNSILNPDGTTREDPRSKEREAVRDELRAHRLKTAKRHLLASSISRAPPKEGLPDPLLDLLFLLPPLLAGPIPDSALLLSSPPFLSLPELLPELAHLVSQSLRTSALALARIANPTTNPSYLHRSIPNLPQSLSKLVDTTQTLSQKTIPSSRLAATSSLVPLLNAHVKALSRLIHALEGKLASPQRDLLLRAQMLPLAAEESSLRAKLNLDGLEKEVYSPEVRGALGNYRRHLRDATARLEAKIRELAIALEAYGIDVGKGGDEGRAKMYREMARVYGDMKKQVKEVEGDLERLKGK
ncbi:hypothetical protein VUR80DRAFT_7200 [Thermomyces stellatus]